MARGPNPRQLVLRRDTATGLTLVGWETDLPVGRFEHLALITESETHALPARDSRDYAALESALYRARQANKKFLEQQIYIYQQRGWYRVPFELGENQEPPQADDVGSYSTAAMQLHYQLTRNRKRAWGLVQQGELLHVRARFPAKPLDELSYQVWYQKQLFELREISGVLLEGNLLICESGLWFEAE